MNNRFTEEDNLTNTNIPLMNNMNTASVGVKGNYQDQEKGLNDKSSNVVQDFINNQKETFAQQMMEKAGEQIKKSWLDRCKCNIE
jgi:hypothetical protein